MTTSLEFPASEVIEKWYPNCECIFDSTTHCRYVVDHSGVRPIELWDLIELVKRDFSSDRIVVYELETQSLVAMPNRLIASYLEPFWTVIVRISMVKSPLLRIRHGDKIWYCKATDLSIDLTPLTRAVTEPSGDLTIYQVELLHSLIANRSSIDSIMRLVDHSFRMVNDHDLHLIKLLLIDYQRSLGSTTMVQFNSWLRSLWPELPIGPSSNVLPAVRELIAELGTVTDAVQAIRDFVNHDSFPGLMSFAHEQNSLTHEQNSLTRELDLLETAMVNSQEPIDMENYLRFLTRVTPTADHDLIAKLAISLFQRMIPVIIKRQAGTLLSLLSDELISKLLAAGPRTMVEMARIQIRLVNALKPKTSPITTVNPEVSANLVADIYDHVRRLIVDANPDDYDMYVECLTQISDSIGKIVAADRAKLANLFFNHVVSEITGSGSSKCLALLLDPRFDHLIGTLRSWTDDPTAKRTLTRFTQMMTR